MNSFFEGLDDEDVTGWLRRYVVGRLYVGALQPGSALPSIRRLAKDSGVDHRRIAEAYRILAADGIVEIREGAGVYVSADREESMRVDRGRWMTDLLHAAWGRRIAPRDLRELVATATTRPLCAGVYDSTRDHRVALAYELEHDFELEVVDLRESGEVRVDLVVGTAFEVADVDAQARRLEVPSVIVHVDPELASGVVRRLEAGRVVAVVSDPVFAERARQHLVPGPYRRRISIVLSESVKKLEDVRVPEGATLLATRAARRDLGAPEFHLLPHVRFIAPASARALCATLMAVRGVER